MHQAHMLSNSHEVGTQDGTSMGGVLSYARERASHLYELPKGSSRLVPMEGMRGLAVLLVFFVHFHALFGATIPGSTIVFRVSHFLHIIGNSGVDLFFILSGFLIYGNLLRRQTPYGKFLMRRVERIYPTFLAVFVLYLALSFAFPDHSKILPGLAPALLQITLNLLLIPGIFHITPIITVAWSLSYEFFFYATLPLMMVVLGIPKWSRPVRIAFLILLWVGYLSIACLVSEARVRMAMFIVGALLYEAYISQTTKQKLTRNGEIAGLLLFAGGLTATYFVQVIPRLIHALNAFGGNDTLVGVPVYQGPLRVLLLGIAMAPFSFYCIAYDGFLSRMMSLTWLRYLGNMSYSYYLIHGLCLQAMALVLLHGNNLRQVSIVTFCVWMLLAFTACWIGSSVLFVLVEKPLSITNSFTVSSSKRIAKAIGTIDSEPSETNKALSANARSSSEA